MPQCCTRHVGRQVASPCTGAAVERPHVMLWSADPGLAKIRADQIELKKGSKDTSPGGPVQLIQKALRYWGCKLKSERALLLPGFGPDGAFGEETRAAVIAFQRESRDDRGVQLNPDGIVGHRTLSALDPIVVPKLRPKPYSNRIVALVDVVIFPDGHTAARLPRILEEANYVFNRADIEIRLGTVWHPDRTGPEACRIFEKNLASGGGPAPEKGWCPSEVLRATVDDITDEARRLAAFRPGGRNRITVYHLAAFPPGATTPWGATFTPRSSGLPFTVMIPKSGTADPVDIWWHELGHCLLNTGPGDVVDGKHDDHSHDIMGIYPVPGLGKASLDIPPAVVKRMRDTAFFDLT